MKKIKFEKPFESFDIQKHINKPYKEQWRIALHDPAVLILYIVIPIVCIILAIIF